MKCQILIRQRGQACTMASEPYPMCLSHRVYLGRSCLCNNGDAVALPIRGRRDNICPLHRWRSRSRDVVAIRNLNRAF